MSFFTKRIIMFVSALIVVAYGIITYQFLHESTVAIAILIGLLIAYMILCLKWWRCPHCDKYLRKTPVFAKHCPHCGGELK